MKELTHDQFTASLKLFAADGFVLDQVEFHHAQFTPAAKAQQAKSVVSTTLHIHNTTRPHRLVIRAKLHVTWSKPTDNQVHPLPVFIKARDVTVLERKAKPAFREILTAATSPKYPRMMPIICRDLNGDGRTDIIAAGINSSIEDQILYRMGESQYATGDYIAMSVTLGRLRRNHPKSKYVDSAEYLLVQSDLKQNKTTEGIKKLTAIIDREPEHPYRARALLERAQLLTDADKLKPAVADYEAFIKLAEQPGRKIAGVNETRVRLNDLYYRLGDYDKAAAMSDTLLQAKDASPVVRQEAMFRKALILIQKEQFGAAMGTFDRLMSDHPKNAFAAQVHYYRGLLLINEHPSDAVQSLQQAVADRKLSNDYRANSLLLISMHQRDKKRDVEAAKTLFELEKVITFDRMRIEDMIWLGQHYIKSNPRSVIRYMQPLIEGKRKVTPAQKTQALFLDGLALKDATIGSYKTALDTFAEVEAMGHGYGLLARLADSRSKG